jgi:hypothetical protein
LFNMLLDKSPYFFFQFQIQLMQESLKIITNFIICSLCLFLFAIHYGETEDFLLCICVGLMASSW